MASEPKTKPTGASVEAFLAGVEHPRRRADGQAMSALMARTSGCAAEMWGAAIVGFGRYVSPSGPWPRIAFSPRKPNLVLYLALPAERREALVSALGPVKTKGGCLYVTDLSKLDPTAVEALVSEAWAEAARRYPSA